MTTIKVLLLEDMEHDFTKLKEIVEQINDEFSSQSIKLSLLYDWEEIHRLVSNYVASKTMEVNLQKPFKEVVLQTVNQIKGSPMLICLLDIVWTMDAKRKRRGAKTDTYGCDFYCDFLSDNPNMIMVTAISQIPNKMKDFEKIDKFINNIPFGNDFKEQLKNKIYKLPIIKSQIIDNESKDQIPSHRM